jgi:uncharacterized membrane protein
MESRAKLFGHPIHQSLIVFPLGLLATSVIFDVIHRLTGNPPWAEMAYWLIAAGVIGGLVAAPFGLIDWLAIPGDTRAKAPAEPALLPFVLSLIGVGIAAVTGWLGGELVDRLAVGVDPGANLNAPSSLSDRPASESVRTA